MQRAEEDPAYLKIWFARTIARLKPRIWTVHEAAASGVHNNDGEILLIEFLEMLLFYLHSAICRELNASQKIEIPYAECSGNAAGWLRFPSS